MEKKDEESRKEQKADRSAAMAKRMVLATTIAEMILLETDGDDEMLVVFNLVVGLLFCGNVRVVN